ncbi:MAG: SRPBCC domain-containing protein [bacterium]
MTTAPLTVSRVFKAPVALVWAVHTDPKHQAQWLSPGNPDGYQSRMDFREGGTHFYGMPAPDGSLMYGIQTFREIVPQKKVVLVQSFADKDGNVAPHPMAPTWPQEMLSTNLYEDLGDGTTKLSVTWEPLNATAIEEATFDGARPGMKGGWDMQFGQIEAYLATL